MGDEGDVKITSTGNPYVNGNKIRVNLTMSDKQISTKEQVEEEVKALSGNSLLLLPIYSAHSAEAEALIDDLLASMNMPTATAVSTAKRRLVVGSLLAIAQQLKLSEQTCICINHGKSHWSEYPAVGHTTVTAVREALLAAGAISKVEGTGRQYFYFDEKGRSIPLGVGTVYEVSEDVLDHPQLLDADWLQTGRSLVEVKVYETNSQTVVRKKKGGKRTKLTGKQIQAACDNDVASFSRPYGKSKTGVQALNRYWQQHPLALRNSTGLRLFVGSCTRKFHNGSMQEGGRYYGSYSYVHKSLRHKATIDGEPVVEVDINACQPTLFSGLQNKRMNVSETWSDLYTEVIANLNFPMLELLEVEDTADLQRKKMKQVVLELIGTGNPNKTYPAKDCDYTFAENAGFGLSEYHVYRIAILETLPAMTLLNSTDNKGSASISYHEAEIMTQTLHKLMAQDIPAYSLHDAVMVKEKDGIVAAEVYRNTFRSYIEQKTGGAVRLLPAASIEREGIKKLRLTGSYS